MLSEWNTLVEDSFEGVGMDSDVEYMGEVMLYKDYLARYQPITVSVAINKFSQIQDGIAEYFLGSLDGSSLPHYCKLVHLCPASIRGGSELDNYLCSLSMLEAMLAMISMGFYNSMTRLTEGFVVAAAALLTHKRRQCRNSCNIPDDCSEADSLPEAQGDMDVREGDRYVRVKSADDVPEHNDTVAYVSVPDESKFANDGEEIEGYLPLRSEYLPGPSKRGRSHSKSAPRVQTISESDSHPAESQLDTGPEYDATASAGGSPKATIDNEERRGVEFTRICRRHDDVKVPEIVVEHITENQR